MGRTPIPDRTALNIKVPNAILARIDARAKAAGLSRTAVIVAALERAFPDRDSDAPAEPPSPRPSFSPARSKTTIEPKARTIPATVKGVAIKPARDLVDAEAAPRPFVSRLKGQWSPAKGKPGGKAR